ncbi:MAG: tetratricopeptide repeat protein [Treponema sp.]|nr:tetratricopeptide repeat protein [Treponema sp.]
MAEKEKKSSSEKLNSFLEKNRIWLLSVLGVAVAVVVVYAVLVTVNAKSNEKVLSEIDEITYVFTKDFSSLEESEIENRRNVAMEALTPYLKKNGVGGVRANMLAADLSFQKKDYSSAMEYYKNAAEKGKKSYTAPLSYYNMGVCAEQLGNLSESSEYYKKAADSEGFILKSHALFSLGRVYEAQKDFEKANEFYTTLINSAPDDSWAKMAKTRVIDLKVKGQIQ